MQSPAEIQTVPKDPEISPGLLRSRPPPLAADLFGSFRTGRSEHLLAFGEEQGADQGISHRKEDLAVLGLFR
jgi:hypothetical protein